MGRAILAIAAALLLGVAVVRSAFVAQYAEVDPKVALGAWAGHPQAELWSALTRIAAAARAGRPVDPTVLRSVDDAALKDPLAAEPFLVNGVQQRLAGDEAAAAKSYQAAELRDGRSVPARYFLADHYLRVGDGHNGLREAAMLARMIPDGVTALAPFVATYAKDPASRPELVSIFRSNPQLADATLVALAKDPGNSDLVLQLAQPGPAAAARPWVAALISSLVEEREYEKAHDIWRREAQIGADSSALIYDTAFRDATAPGPFNWTLTSSALGLAERKAGGRLHVIYYAQDDGVLASQLLVLAPGRYRIGMQVAGDLRNIGLLGWRLTCVDSRQELLKLRLSATVQGSFEVPRGCPAQELELAGSAPDLAQAVDVTISGLTLTREQSSD